MVLHGKTLAEFPFIEALLAVILAWVLVALWERVIENFAFGTLGLDPESSFHALIVAVVATIIFVAFTFSINNVVEDVVIGETTSMFEPPQPPVSLVGVENSEGSGTTQTIVTRSLTDIAAEINKTIPVSSIQETSEILPQGNVGYGDTKHAKRSRSSNRYNSRHYSGWGFRYRGMARTIPAQIYDSLNLQPPPVLLP